MAMLPYGFDVKRPYLNDGSLRECSTTEEAWVRLESIQSYMKNCEPLPPELAHWLGEAIEHSKRDRTEFMQRLGLSRRTGERSRYSRRFKEYWQGKLWELSVYNEVGQGAEKIIQDIQDEMTADSIENVPDRATLQDWLNEALTGNKRIR